MFTESYCTTPGVGVGIGIGIGVSFSVRVRVSVGVRVHKCKSFELKFLRPHYFQTL